MSMSGVSVYFCQLTDMTLKAAGTMKIEGATVNIN